MVLGENFILNINKKDLRISRDWVGDQWINIQAKPDILSAIPETISPDTKISMSSTIAKDLKCDGVALSCIEVPISSQLNIIEETKPDLATLTSSDSHLDDMDCIDDIKPSSSNDIANDGGNDVNVSHDKEDEGNDEGEVGGDVNDNGDRLDMEVFETSEKNCKAIELMEVTA